MPAQENGVLAESGQFWMSGDEWDITREHSLAIPLLARSDETQAYTSPSRLKSIDEPATQRREHM